MRHNQEDIASADGLKTLCMGPLWMAGQLDTAAKVNGHGCVATSRHIVGSEGVILAKIQV